MVTKNIAVPLTYSDFVSLLFRKTDVYIKDKIYGKYYEVISYTKDSLCLRSEQTHFKVTYLEALKEYLWFDNSIIGRQIDNIFIKEV